jgi:hypothetical protein
VRGGVAATHKFIPGLSNAYFSCGQKQLVGKNNLWAKTTCGQKQLVGKNNIFSVSRFRCKFVKSA